MFNYSQNCNVCDNSHSSKQCPAHQSHFLCSCSGHDIQHMAAALSHQPPQWAAGKPVLCAADVAAGAAHLGYRVCGSLEVSSGSFPSQRAGYELVTSVVFQGDQSGLPGALRPSIHLLGGKLKVVFALGEHTMKAMSRNNQ